MTDLLQRGSNARLTKPDRLSIIIEKGAIPTVSAPLSGKDHHADCSCHRAVSSIFNLSDPI